MTGPRPTLGRLPLAVLLTVLLATASFLWRGIDSFRGLTEPPGIALTSGFEEESWLALWRTAHGQEMFVDSTRLPYSSSYFNWLFYRSYGLAARIADWLGGASAIPAGARGLTLFAALAGMCALSAALRGTGVSTPEAWALGITTFAGPLVGWWAFTARPDVAALAFEAAGLGLILAGKWRSDARILIWAGLAFACAWSMKQTYVFGLMAGAGLLLFRREWKGVQILGGIWLASVAVSFGLMGRDYREAFGATAVTNVFYWQVGMENLADLAMRTAPLWFLPLALLAELVRTRRAPADAEFLGLFGLIAATPVTFALSCKVGAHSNYYFTVSLFLAIANAAALTALRPRWLRPALFTLLASVLTVSLSHLLLTQPLASQRLRLRQIWSEWSPMPEPRYSSIEVFNLPWLSPGSPPIVLAFNYPFMRARSVEFEGGGLGGLIEAKRFRSLLLPADTADTHDGGSLASYTKMRIVDGYAIYALKEDPPAR